MQQQREVLKVNGNSMIPTSRIAILSIITFVLLTNSAVMNITATVFYNYGSFVPTFQIGLLFMDQVYKSFAAIIPYCLHFFFLSTVLVISHEHVGGRLAHNFSFNLSFSHFHIIAKGYSTFFALYYTKGLGSDEIYELLLSCQIMSAFLLIVSAIPLLQFPSFLTGFSISPLVSCLSIFSFVVIISANILFINEMIYYNSEWFIDPMESSADNYLSICYLDILLLSVSITLTLYLCLSVLKYLNNMPYKEMKVSGLEDEQSKKHELAEEKFLVKDFVNKSQNSSCDIALIEHEEIKLELTSRSIEEGNVTRKEGVSFGNNGPESKVNGSEIHLTSGNSLSNQYGITRADKRQFASILDEFWGIIFDYHGNLTEEAKNIGVSVIFDILDVESPACTESQIRIQKDEVALSNGYINEVFEHARLTTGYMVNWTQNYLTSFPNYAREDEVVYNAVEKLTWGGRSIYTLSGTQKKQLTYEEVERLVLHSLKICIRKISSLNSSEWLFCENDGCDEKLIEQLARSEKFLNKGEGCDLDEGSIVYPLSISFCGKECVWRASLVLSFAVWSIRRILLLISKETRPELWGKFTYVLNRVQGLLDLIFSKPRAILLPCKCLRASECNIGNSGMTKVTCKRDILELIKEAEAFSLKRKGHAGTAAGDIAFPKGKQNLISAFRRYKRKLSN